MAFKSGFTDEHSTVRNVMAPGPLRAVCGFHYQEFTNLADPERLTPDPYRVGEQNTGSVWEEFIVPDTAKVISWLDDPYWHFPAITRNNYGAGALTYEGTLLSDTLQREVIRDLLKQLGMTGPHQELPPEVRVRQGRSPPGKAAALLSELFRSGADDFLSLRRRRGSDHWRRRPAWQEVQNWSLGFGHRARTIISGRKTMLRQAHASAIWFQGIAKINVAPRNNSSLLRTEAGSI